MTPTVADALAVMRGLFIPCQQGAYDPGTAPQNASISMPLKLGTKLLLFSDLHEFNFILPFLHTRSARLCAHTKI